MIKRELAAISVVMLLSACTPEPKTYDDCILQKISDTTPAVTVEVIKEACRNKFPAKDVKIPASVAQELPAEALKLLTGKLYITDPQQYVDEYGNPVRNNESTVAHGYIYNGNKDWSVISVLVGVRYKPDGEYKFYRVSIDGSFINSFSKANYEVAVEDRPRTNNFTYADYEWGVAQAHGYYNDG